MDLKNAVEACLELSPKGECRGDPYGSIGEWDVSHITDMNGMFTDANSFDGDLSKWEVLKVENMYAMFWGAKQFNGDLSNWDVSSVQNMNHMFYKAAAFNRDLSKWDVSSVTTMIAMFRQATSFNGDLSNWDVKNVQHMDEMFCNAVSFTQEICAYDWVYSKASKIDMFKGTPEAISSSEICTISPQKAAQRLKPQSKKELKDAVDAYVQLLQYRQNPQRHSEGDDEVRTALTAAISKGTPMWDSGGAKPSLSE